MSDPRDSQSVFMRGAVDLSALRQPSPPPAGPSSPGGAAAAGQPPAGGQAGGPAGGVVKIDVTEATFQSEVLSGR